LPLACGACGALNVPDGAYCVACGGQLGPSDSVRSARDGEIRQTGRFPAVGGLEGERKQVTVLFADLGGSLSAIAGVDPEEAEALLNAVVVAMIEAVHRFAGTVNQVLGDGIMALFGAPASHEDHAVRAACSALAMQAAVRKLQSESWKSRGLRPEIRVGLNSGEVVVRSVRNDMSHDYRAIGSTTHLAARMEQTAARGTIRVTEGVVRLGRGMLRTRPLGPMSIRGLPNPINAYELTGVATRTRFQATIERGLSPLAGRKTELRVLEDALSGALEGHSGAVVVTGEPGLGKSRLCHELLRSAPARTCRLLEASATSYGRATPHGLLVGLLKSLFEIGDDHGLEEIATAVSALSSSFGLSDERRNVVLEMFDVPTEDGAWRRLDPVQRLRTIEQTCEELLARWCQRGSAILLLEDLHWADADSVAFVRKLLESPPGPQTLVLITARPELRAPWPSVPHVRHCALAALALDDAQTLLRALVGSDESLAGIRSELAERTQGNPFFIEESTRAYADMGVFEGQPGSYVLRGGPEEALVPPAIEALIGARLDRLAPEVLDLLQAAAVIGDDSPTEVLRTVTGTTEETFRERFAVLEAADLLYQTGPFRAPLFRFRHALLRDVAYRRILRTRRRLVHGSVVEAFESLYPTRLAEHVERLAEHANQAGALAKAARYHGQACTRAANRWANAQAIEHLERGMEVLSRMEATPGRDELAIDLRLIALAPLLPVGDHEQVISLLTEAEALARARDDKKRLAKIYSQLGTALWVTARYDRAMEVVDQARTLAIDLGDFALATASQYCTGMIHHARGDLEQALSEFVHVAETLGGPLSKRRLGWAGYPSVLARTFILSSYGLLGRFDEADQVFADGHRLAEEIDHAYTHTLILEEYAFCRLVRGEAREARQLLESALAICRDSEVNVMHAPVAARLGAALVECGEPRAARALLEDALSTQTYRLAAHYGLDFILVALSEAYLRTGDPELALETAERAEEATRSAGEHAYHVCALVQLGNVLASIPRHADRADEAYRRAAERAAKIGMVPSQALVLQGQATLHARRGDVSPALACLDEADALWRSVNAPVRRAQLAVQREETARRHEQAPA
jgi:class 3 adenylate cyclase/tetratricopeptide (TPR) repeat protein